VEQSKMVEDNHDLIYWFCHKRNLIVDDWYDILAITLCEVVQKFDPERGALSTLVYKSFNNEVGQTRIKASRQKRINLNKLVELDDSNLADEVNFVELICNNDFLSRYKDNEILILKAKGYTQCEISEKLGVSQSYVSRSLAEIKKEYMNETDR